MILVYFYIIMSEVSILQKKIMCYFLYRTSVETIQLSCPWSGSFEIDTREVSSDFRWQKLDYDSHWETPISNSCIDYWPMTDCVVTTNMAYTCTYFWFIMCLCNCCSVNMKGCGTRVQFLHSVYSNLVTQLVFVASGLTAESCQSPCGQH